MNATAARSDYKDILKRAEIFHHAPEAVVAEIASGIITTHYKAGETIIHKNDKGSSMYIIRQGRVKIHDGEMVIAELKEGDFFGEFSLLDDEPRSMSVTALSPTEAGIIHRNDFFKVLNHHTDVTKDIIKILVTRLRRQNGKIISQMMIREDELRKLVDERTLDLKKKNEELAKTLSELKRMQEQLIMQEKLATLGQLTAGIAHEIRNPLNFINNFSLLSKELIDELAESGTNSDQKELINMIRENLTKVNDHGKRADNIVKSMMLHARDSSRHKAAADINRILDEAVNLAYHGLQSGEKNFNISVEKELDCSIPEMNIVSVDLNRVFLNIISNSFYALKEKVQKYKADGKEFGARVLVSSRKTNGSVQILIRDNGTGIPASVRDKIFNPFFTTKPAGQGTGLGLSISNDIVKAHGGTMTIASEENEFTEFLISLPLDSLI